MNDAVAVRRAAVAAARDAGPPDMVFVAASGLDAPPVAVLGADTSSAAAVAAAIAAIVREPHERTDTGSGRQIDAVYCTYNALSRVDVCVAAAVPGTVRAQALRDDGSEVLLDDELWEETALCAMARALLYGDMLDDGGPVAGRNDALPGLRRLPALQDAVSQLRFLEAAARVINRAVECNAATHQLDTHFIVRAVLRLFVDTARVHEAAAYFARFGSSGRTPSTARLQMDAVAARCYGLAGNEPRAFALLCDALAGAGPDEFYDCHASTEALKDVEDSMSSVALDSAASAPVGSNASQVALFGDADMPEPNAGCSRDHGGVNCSSTSLDRMSVASDTRLTPKLPPLWNSEAKSSASIHQSFDTQASHLKPELRPVGPDDSVPLLLAQTELLLGRVAEGHFVDEALHMSRRAATLRPLDPTGWLVHAQACVLAGKLETALVALNNVPEHATCVSLTSRGLPAERQGLDMSGRHMFSTSSPAARIAHGSHSRKPSIVGRLIAKLHSSSTVAGDGNASHASLHEHAEMERVHGHLARLDVRPAVARAFDVLALAVRRHGWPAVLSARAGVFVLQEGAQPGARLCEPWLDALFALLYDALRAAEDALGDFAPADALCAAAVVLRLGDDAAGTRLLRSAAEQRSAPAWMRRRAWSSLLDMYAADGRLSHALLACEGIFGALVEVHGAGERSGHALDAVRPAMRRMCAEHGAGRMRAALRAVSVSQALSSCLESVIASMVVS